MSRGGVTRIEPQEAGGGRRRQLSRRELGGRGGRGGAGRGRAFPAPHLRNLVLVACHSVYTGLDFRNSEEQSSWFLLEYQKASWVGREAGGGGGGADSPSCQL